MTILMSQDTESLFKRGSQAHIRLIMLYWFTTAGVGEFEAGFFKNGHTCEHSSRIICTVCEATNS